MNDFFKRRFTVLALLACSLTLLLGIQISPGISQTVSQAVSQTAAQTVSQTSAQTAPSDIPAPAWQPAQGSWQPVASHRKDKGSIKVVWLQGTPYEMGYQHGTLLHDEIASLGEEVMGALRFSGRGLALGRLAMRRSFPDVIEECRGLSDATQDIGMTMDACMVLAYADVYQEQFAYLLPEILFHEGCAGFVSMGDASIDGHLYHARTLDNNNKPIDYWIKNPTVFIRQPSDGIPHVFTGIPGAVWPNSGFNAEGVSISLDTAHPRTFDDISLKGASNVQLMAKIMKQAHSYEEAKALMSTWEHARANLILIADGKSKQAGVFEILGRELGIREVSNNGTLYMTNHFVAPETAGKDPDPAASSLSRYKRLQQVFDREGAYTNYGQFNAEAMVKVLRDRTDPATLQVSPLSVYDDDVSVGGNGSMRQELFDNDRLLFWVAGGSVPIPENPFVCFSFGEMIGLPNAVPCEKSSI
ncbi:MAG TPA: C45 family peptidase [Coleofasciculaceae cyanobacterium]|jgi:hypothetical protein